MDSREEALKRKKALEESNKKINFESSIKKNDEKSSKTSNKNSNPTDKSKIKPSKTKPKTKVCESCESRIPMELYSEDLRFADNLKKICKNCEENSKQNKSLETLTSTVPEKIISTQVDNKIENKHKSLNLEKKVSKKEKKLSRYLIFISLGIFVFMYFFNNSNQEEKIVLETSSSTDFNPTTTDISTSSTVIVNNNSFQPEIFIGEALNVEYDEDWPALYSIELTFKDSNYVEVLVESRNLTKFRYILYNGCEFSYISGQKTFNKERKKLLPNKLCTEKEFETLSNKYENVKIILEGNGHEIEIFLVNDRVIFPNSNQSGYCCSTLSLYQIHAAINNVVVELNKNKSSNNNLGYSINPNCETNVENVKQLFRYYEEDISNQFGVWSTNVGNTSGKTNQQIRDQYFADKNKVLEMLEYARVQVESLPEPLEDSLYNLYYSKLIQVKRYANEYFEVYELYYEQASIDTDQAIEMYNSIIDKWVDAEIKFAQLNSCEE